MSKRFTLTQTTIYTLFFVFGLTIFSFGQTTDLQGDLQKSFKDFNLVKFNNRTALQSVQTENRLSIPTVSRNFELDLTPNDLRAPRYRAENTDGNGVQAVEKDAAITTFKGKVSGEDGSEARMSIDGAKIEGYFISGGEMFIVEQARKFSPGAGKEDYVVYRQQDILNPQSFTCDADVSEKIEQGKELVAAIGFQSPQAIRVIEMATEADFEFVNTLGGAGAANQEILNILNMVDGVYQNELSLSIKVVYQHTWTTQDPFNSASANTLLTSFQSYWNTNLPATVIPRDAVHLFSGRTAFSGVGLAYIGVVCKSPANAYGFTGRINIAPLKFELTAHEIGHNLGANHVDATQSCANTIMNATLSDTTPFTFCAYSRTEITTFVSANNGCLSAPVPVRNRFDFDGDKRAEISVFRPSNGAWYIRNANTGSFTGVLFGQAGDKPVAADYDGDGRADLAVFRGGNWFRLNSSNGAFISTAFGFSTDLPVPADFDGDGAADIAVFRPSNGAWYILSSISGNFSGVTFGQSGDVPLPADYDGDGRADVNVFRPSNGAWYRLNSSNGNFTGVTFGQSDDIPIAGDFDGDGRADNVVFRTSNGAWYILRSRDFSFTGTIFGFGSDTPIAADYDGDGITDIAVFRPATGGWYRINSTTGGFVGVQFGIDTDIPVEAY